MHVSLRLLRPAFVGAFSSGPPDVAISFAPDCQRFHLPARHTDRIDAGDDPRLAR